MNMDLLHITSQFEIEDNIVSINALGEGFINDTYIVKTEGNAPDYILQRKNHVIFPDVPAMMNNIALVTSHLKNKVLAVGGDPMREVLTPIPAKNGLLYYKDDKGNFWAVCLFIENSVTLDKADTPKLAYKGGEGIGKFQTQLADFDKPLAETIKGFHNIRWRFTQWDETLTKDAAGRKTSLAREIDWIESRRKQMLDFWELVENRTIPMRVTHNDTKISNILFDEKGDVLCVIDLDTVMNSTSLNDFGDAIRSYTNTGAEDDRNLENVTMSLDMFRGYAEGYLSQRKDTLSKIELEYLAFSAKYITYEQVLRFLMDYIDGDKYYKIHYPEHNLIRTHAQYKLLQSIENQYDKMQRVISEIV